jgi:3-oxoacyl-[acyl-carrier-protein] synthase II
LSFLITGLGWVTAGGEGRGRNADPFGYSLGSLPGLTGRSRFPNRSFRRFGRLDKFSKLGLSAAAYALQDAGLDVWREKRDIGVIVSTVLGCLATDFDYYGTVMIKNGTLADPNLFTYTLPNTFLGHVSIIFGLTGTNFIVNEKTGTGISALCSAMDCISLGECDTMIAGICDIEPPAGFSVSEKPIPGAIFVVIEKGIDRQIQPYGSLSMNNIGRLFFNGSEINDISTLVKNCLRAEIV